MKDTTDFYKGYQGAITKHLEEREGARAVAKPPTSSGSDTPARPNPKGDPKGAGAAPAAVRTVSLDGGTTESPRNRGKGRWASRFNRGKSTTPTKARVADGKATASASQQSASASQFGVRQRLADGKLTASDVERALRRHAGDINAAFEELLMSEGEGEGKGGSEGEGGGAGGSEGRVEDKGSKMGQAAKCREVESPRESKAKAKAKAKLFKDAAAKGRVEEKRRAKDEARRAQAKPKRREKEEGQGPASPPVTLELDLATPTKPATPATPATVERLRVVVRCLKEGRTVEPTAPLSRHSSVRPLRPLTSRSVREALSESALLLRTHPELVALEELLPLSAAVVEIRNACHRSVHDIYIFFKLELELELCKILVIVFVNSAKFSPSHKFNPGWLIAKNFRTLNI